ncbi:ABC transporter permease subunit [Jeotgalibacillus haloalkalitolerans]|uniref:ABC transporter permease subunit n=1 Tax=Jeotgalibacillus haloalkalitolerans TaxID=3104292 RepID=A0ABU5KPK8_9BACL|nr:ABC transporter permease subunit [Jeotgalibacillus sp. HH7-29]MDZ5713183.1 ABC transporter permease subunit [Jeotgalibacillus sp. HH7-29]
MNRHLTAGGIMLLFLLFLTFIGPLFPIIDNDRTIAGARYTDNGFEVAPFPPSAETPLGSDREGRDVLSLLVDGAQETLYIILSIVAIRFILAALLGIGGYYSKSIRGVLSLWSQLFSFMPSIFFVIFFAGLPFVMFSENRYLWLIFIIAAVEVGRTAELIKTSMDESAKKAYFEAGIVTGCSNWTLFKYYFWPELRLTALTNFINDLGKTLFLIAQLTLVGVFFQNEFWSVRGGTVTTENGSYIWPALLEDIHQDVFTAEWVILSTVGMITFTMLTFYLLSNGIRRYYQEKYHQSN